MWTKDFGRSFALPLIGNLKMNYPAASCGVSKELYDNFPKVVTPECFYRGSSPSFAWIPAKSMRE